MSTLKTNNVQVGQSVTATNNFTLYQPATPDGTVRLGVGNTGATTADVLTLNGNGALALRGAVTSASGVGITFPATQSASTDANTLDDYEEGTWTPSYTGATNPTVVYAEQSGFYTKVGNIVTVTCHLNAASASGGSGDLRISGLPFIMGKTGGADGYRSAFLIGYSQGFTSTTTPTSIISEINQTYCICRTYATSDARSNTTGTVSVSAIYSGGRLYLSMTYLTN
jgi:hypothetical protein